MKRGVWIALFAATCVAQVAVPGWLLVRRETTLSRGEAFRFACAPVDPVDFLRGRYVALGFRDTAARAAPGFEPVPGQQAYVTLSVDSDRFARPELLVAEPPSGASWIEVGVSWSALGDDGPVLAVRWPFDRFFLPEEIAPAAERVYQDELSRGVADMPTVWLEVRVWCGWAVPEELYVDGVPITDFVRSRAGVD